MRAASRTHPGTHRGQRRDLPPALESRSARSSPGGGEKRGLYAEVAAESAAETERLIGAGSLDGLDFEEIALLAALGYNQIAEVNPWTTVIQAFVVAL